MQFNVAKFFGLDVIGVDLDSTLIQYANENFELSNEKQYKFYNDDMRDFCSNTKEINSDVLVLANSIYYIPKNDFILMLKNIKQNSLIKEDSTLLFVLEAQKDYRNKR